MNISAAVILGSFFPFSPASASWGVWPGVLQLLNTSAFALLYSALLEKEKKMRNELKWGPKNEPKVRTRQNFLPCSRKNSLLWWQFRQHCKFPRVWKIIGEKSLGNEVFYLFFWENKSSRIIFWSRQNQVSCLIKNLDLPPFVWAISTEEMVICGWIYLESASDFRDSFLLIQHRIF